MTHPILPAGYNADSNNDDEVDGAGTNWPIWPVLFDTFVSLEVLIMTDEMLAAFGGCPDLIIPCVDDTITYPCEDETLVFTDRWPDYIVPSVSRTVGFPRQQRATEVSR